MDWVKTENERTAKILEADPRYAEMHATALKALESPDRLPIPDLHGDMVYNIWQDAQHVRGILRRATVADYANAQPHWETVIDYDALGKADNQKWVGKGINCLYPETGLCLVELSAGGEDKTTLREFDSEQASSLPVASFCPPRNRMPPGSIRIPSSWPATGVRAR